jgi:alpha-L-fucosidase
MNKHKTISSRLKAIDTTIAKGPFKPDWESLSEYRIPQWYKDAKFGIFIHWGVYSVPAFGNEWYPREMYCKQSTCYAHHLAVHGKHSEFGYKDFIPQFTAKNFNALDWTGLFKRAGAKFVVPVAEHHDGFAMYQTDLSPWNAAAMGPKRDIIKELADASRVNNLIFGLSSHRAEHWWFFNGGMEFDSDVKSGKYADFYGPAKPRETAPDKTYLNDWLMRTCELVDKYEPAIVWFDWWIEEASFASYLKKFGAYLYNRGARWKYRPAINYKMEAFAPEAAVFDIERGQLSGIRPLFWQTDTSVSKNSWGYISHHDYKKATSLVHDLVDIVSKNGALLLNIGPRPDGTIPDEERARLLAIGAWLKINGEAIYETRPWKVFGEGPTQVAEGGFTELKRSEFTHADVRFTTRGNNVLYAIVLGWPPERKLCIRKLSENNRHAPLEITGVSLLGSSSKISWKRSNEGLSVALPAEKPCEHAIVLKITHRG